MTTILVVDDDENILYLVDAYLKAEGYTVHQAKDGKYGLAMFKLYPPELVILDVMLPGIDGLEVLQQLRRTSDVYVLLLTAKSEETDRIVGLTVGADDYLTKPFSPRELVARVKAILRRGRNTPRIEDSALTFENLRIDTQRYQVWRDDQEIELAPVEFKILRVLALHSGMVLSRDQILEQVWGHDFYGDDRLVDVHIGRIRQKLEVDASHPRFIITVRGVGYKFKE